MKFSKQVLLEKFESKEYTFCINMLTDEIIKILSDEIRTFDSEFKYKNIANLRTNCLKYLDFTKKSIALELYDFMFHEEYTETFILDGLLNMYEILTKDYIYQE